MTIVLAYLFIYVRDVVCLRQTGKQSDQKNRAETGNEASWKKDNGIIAVISPKRSGIGTARMIALIAAAVIPFLIYLWSNSQAVYEYSGAVNVPLFTAFRQDPKFFIKFLLKSFASMVLE